jgi:hypothetical protein
MGKSRNTTPYRILVEDNDGEHPPYFGGMWERIGKKFNRELNRRQRHIARQKLRRGEEPDPDQTRSSGKWEYY